MCVCVGCGSTDDGGKGREGGVKKKRKSRAVCDLSGIIPVHAFSNTADGCLLAYGVIHK